MDAVAVEKAGLKAFLDAARNEINGTPVYRAVGPKGYAAYRATGLLIPTKDYYTDVIQGGVHFWLDPDMAAGRERPLIAVSSLELLSKGRRYVDTRIKGHDAGFITLLEKSRGAGSYNGWDIWLEIIRNDTIVMSHGRNGPTPVYTRRNPVRQEELLYEIRVADISDAVPEPDKVDYSWENCRGVSVNFF